MKRIKLYLIISIICLSGFSQKKDTTIVWTWKGKTLDKKSVLDSIKADYIFYCDSIKRREKIIKNSGLQ